MRKCSLCNGSGQVRKGLGNAIIIAGEGVIGEVPLCEVTMVCPSCNGGSERCKIRLNPGCLMDFLSEDNVLDITTTDDGKVYASVYMNSKIESIPVVFDRNVSSYCLDVGEDSEH